MNEEQQEREMLPLPPDEAIERLRRILTLLEAIEGHLNSPLPKARVLLRGVIGCGVASSTDAATQMRDACVKRVKARLAILEKQTSESGGLSRACCEGRDAAIREIVTSLESLTLDLREKR